MLPPAESKINTFLQCVSPWPDSNFTSNKSSKWQVTTHAFKIPEEGELLQQQPDKQNQSPKFWTASEHVKGIPQAVFSSVASPQPALVILQSFLVLGQGLSCCLDLKPCTESILLLHVSWGKKKNTTKQTKTNMPLHYSHGLLRLRRNIWQGISSQASLIYQRHGQMERLFWDVTLPSSSWPILVIPAISLWQMRGNPSLVLTENIFKNPPQNQSGLSNWAFRRFPDQQESFSPSGPVFSKWQAQSICHDFDSAWLCHFNKLASKGKIFLFSEFSYKGPERLSPIEEFKSAFQIFPLGLWNKSMGLIQKSFSLWELYASWGNCQSRKDLSLK